MEQDYSKILSDAKSYVAEVADSLTPESCEIFDSIQTDRHYTAVVLMPDDIAEKMHSFALKLKEVDSSLILTDRASYHLTLNYIPGDKDVERFRNILKSFFEDNPVSFSLDTLFISPRGIGVCAYPDNDSLIRLRAMLGKAFDFPFSLTSLKAISWITLARCSQPPKQELIDYLKQRFNTDFGKLAFGEVAVFESSNKILEDAKKLYGVLLK